MADVACSSAFTNLKFHASGGCGGVFKAYNRELDRWVALKYIKNECAGSPRAETDFQFEAEVTGRLDHPGAVPIYGLGRDSSGRSCDAMRFVRGLTFSALDPSRSPGPSDRQPGRPPGAAG